MSSSASEIFATSAATSAQSRRVACDRCHRLKLRCERNPVLENGRISTVHGACRRCTKAQKPCNTSSNSTPRPRVPASEQNVTLSDHAPLTPFPSASPLVLSHDMSISDLDSFCGNDPTPLNGLDNAFDFNNLDNLTSSSIGTPGIFGAQPDSKTHSDTEDYGTFVVLPPSGIPLACSPVRAHNKDTPNGTSPNDSSGESEHFDDFVRGVLGFQSILFEELRAISPSDLAEAFRKATPQEIESNRNGGLVDRVMRASEYTIDLLHSPYLADNLRANNVSPTQSRFVPFRSTSMDMTNNSFHKDSISQHRALPAVISFLSCYVALLSVYRNIFTHVHDALRAGAIARPTSQSRRSAGSSTDETADFRTETRRLQLSSQGVLGVRIQIEVLTHMLEKMEDAWSEILEGKLASYDSHDDGSMIGNSRSAVASGGGGVSTIGVLRMMLQHEGFDSAGRTDALGLESLMAIVKGIKSAMRGNSSTPPWRDFGA
ncbi:hypothetical protein G7Y79_00039g076220 [Physcia stellaris]|nr:hypothetical protein G7Y79_00039g076220 [Physcia stellaris]